MESSEDHRQEQLGKWLRLFGGPGYKGRETIDHALEEMRAKGEDELFPLLASKLHDSDIDIRCNAMRAVLEINATRGIELVLPLMNDPDTTMRWGLCGLMHDFGDDRAIEPLIERMKNDPDPQVRGVAAYALGGIGNPRAMPALLETLKNDHELDRLGHSPSSGAEQAIEDIKEKSNNTTK